MVNRQIFVPVLACLLLMASPALAGLSLPAAVASDDDALRMAEDAFVAQPVGHGWMRAFQLESMATTRAVLVAAGGGSVDLGALAALAGQHQAAFAGGQLASVEVASHDLPSEAIGVLMNRMGVAASDADVAAMAELDALEPTLRAAFTGVIDAFLSFDGASRAAYGAVDAARWLAVIDGADATQAFAALDLGGVLAARAHLVEAATELASFAPIAVANACTPGMISDVIAWDLNGCDTTFAADVVLSIDMAGQDVYLNNAGGNSALGSNPHGITTCQYVGVAPATALIDLAGNDSYGNPDQPRDCGTNGGAVMGAGLLVDLGVGDDHYAAGLYAVNGGGHAGGVGLLLDEAGQDRYQADSVGVNGGGKTGLGALIDGDGDDVYVAGDAGTNGGGSLGGAGFLVDLGGQDSYISGNFGGNGGGDRQGAGFLVDLSGDDHYSGAGGANGGGAEGVGYLYDGYGSDTYSGAVGANGGTVHGAGMLIDASGNDQYNGGARGVNGGSTGDAGSGFLFDRSGDDVYLAQWGGVNGGARLGSTGLLLDGGGVDIYDSLEQGSGADQTVAPKGPGGAQVDLPF